MMQFIGALSGGRTVTQVALNWLIAKGKLQLIDLGPHLWQSLVEPANVTGDDEDGASQAEK